MTIISNSLFYAKHLFNEVDDIAQSDLVNSRTIKDLWSEIQGLSSTCPVFKYFQGLEFRRKKFKYFQGCVGTLHPIK